MRIIVPRPLVVAIATAAVLLPATSALSIPADTPLPIDYEFSPTSGPPGTEVTASGDSCPPDTSRVFLYFQVFDDDPLEIGGPFEPAGDGSFSVSASIPADAPVTLAQVGAQCCEIEGACQATQYVLFAVTAPPPEPTTTTIPTTTTTTAAAEPVTPTFTG